MASKAGDPTLSSTVSPLVTSFTPGSRSSSSPTSPRPSNGGIGSGPSSLSPTPSSETPLRTSSSSIQGTDSKPPEQGEKKEQPVPASASPALAASKSTDHPERHDAHVHEQNLAVWFKVRRIGQRFLIRQPHTFVAIALTFIPLYYGFKTEGLAYSGTVFVGVGGTVYCLVRALFLEIIPNWMLPRTEKTLRWRQLMNITYTGFITVMCTTAIWKLPDIAAWQGLAFLGLTFAAPYPLLRKWYPDIDKQPTWAQEMYDSDPTDDA